MTKTPGKKPEDYAPATRLAHAAREYSEHGIMNPAVYHASTVLFPDCASLHAYNQPYVYGRRGTPTSRAVESAIALVEGGHNCKVCPSGMAAITTALLAFLQSGDHLLMTDTVYSPARQLCDGLLKGLGIETTYYDPMIGGRIAELIRPNTRVVYLESPGSQSMEIQDVPAIADAARKAGCVSMIDNTWSAGHYFKAFSHGCDMSIQAATKYLVGHSDAMLGAVTCNAEVWPKFKEAFEAMGQFAGPDDMYLALRGIRTLDVRLERHMKNGLELADWLRGRPEVETVLHPGLPNAPGHTLWKRDFTGASGLFSVIFKTESEKAIAAFIDNLSLFGIGFSWGGYESLAVPFHPTRTAVPWQSKGRCVRFHAGLEAADDLKADLAEGLACMNKAEST